ncbi:10402_t:CDS:10 [Paraglomus occultum]|uniref:10402_t:CDS:1 n=1 Tax=Paraglomus occultum TaxID=144539 RepID=A0A9N9F6B6_9GLOM|nr:10402_t:CDS:10 [Paraglomus occultum]
MNANAPTFIPQNATVRAGASTSSSCDRRSPGHAYSQSRSSHPHENRKFTSGNSRDSFQSDQSVARLNHSNKRSNPRRKNNGSSRYDQRSFPTTREKQKNSSFDYELNDVPSTDDNAVSSSSVQEVATAMSDLTIANDDPAIYGVPDRKGRISLNHLLRFSFPERQQTPAMLPRRHRPSNYQPYNKERFVNANFRFLVKSTGDYTVYQVDPDILLNWSDIEQVQPTAARITKCGHSYCLSCIIHYLQLIDDEEKPNKKWRKCPICWDAIYARDLKSVRFWIVEDLKRLGNSKPAESAITMRLIYRSMSSTIALPRTSTWSSRENDSATESLPWHFTPNALAFAKMMLASADYMKTEYHRDLRELDEILEEARHLNYQEEIPFIEMAIVTVQDQLDLLQKPTLASATELEKRTHSLTESTKVKNVAEELEIEGGLGYWDDMKSVVRSTKAGGKVQETFSNEDYGNYSLQSPNSRIQMTNTVSEDDIPAYLPDEFRENAHIATQESLHEPTDNPAATKANVGNTRDPVYHFYQAGDGQHVYLHPLDIRLLKHEFGSFENFPNTITLPVVGVQESTMTEDLRKRFKYLNHLPLSCDVTFIEADLTDIVSTATLQAFKKELDQRERRRKEKFRIEQKQQKKTVGERKFNEDYDFSFQPLPSERNNTRDEISDSESSERGNSVAPRVEYNGPRTVWGTPAVSFADVTRGRGSEEDDVFYDFQEEEVYFGKKQKRKKLVLMSTNGNRRQ